MEEQPDSESKIAVRRAGKIIGEFAPEDFDRRAEAGEFVATDLCRDHLRADWLPLDVVRKRRMARVFSKAEILTEEATAWPPSSKRSGRGRSRGIPAEILLALFLALIVAAVASAWGYYQTLDRRATATRLETALADAEKLRAELKTATSALGGVPEGTVSGQVILRNQARQRTVIPGMKIRLYRRSDLEDYLRQRFEEFRAAPPQDAISALLSGMPSPLDTTATDTDGKFSIQLPEPGQYVLQTSTLDRKTRDMRIWMLTFDSADTLNTPILISEFNASTTFDPLLILTEGR
jgi:hypothetical protein